VKQDNIKFSVFTKAWKQLSIDELGRFINSIGIAGIEFPLREGYQVEPKDAEKGLLKLAEQLGGYGLKIYSVASDTSEKVFAGCQAAGVPIIRIIVHTDLKDGFYASMQKTEKEIEKIIPLCEKYGVKVGIQHHYGPGLNNSMELRQLVGKYDPRHIGAVWDAAHSALAGEEPEQGLEIVWSHLCIVNLKNAFYRLVTGPEAETAGWDYYFTTGRQGLSSWDRISAYLKEKDFKGTICLFAEYSDEEHVNKLIADDIAYSKTLFAEK